jgi:hypothetical protein
VDPNHSRWLRNIIEACNRVIDEGAKHDDPWLNTIVADARALRDRLQLELRQLGAADDGP